MTHTKTITLGQRLRSLREAAGLSVYALAQRSGVTRQFLAEIERGEKEPTWGRLKAITLSLGAKMADWEECL